MSEGPAGSFLDRFDEWVARDNPPEEWRIAVYMWVHAVVDDPYASSVEHPIGVPGLRWAEVPLPFGSDHAQAVVCEYLVDQDTGQVTCNTIITLDRPL